MELLINNSQDLGEYGIAPRRVRAKAEFSDFTAATTDDSGRREVLAWERTTADAPSASTSSGFNLFEGGHLVVDYRRSQALRRSPTSSSR